MELVCPCCNEQIEVEDEFLPHRACDTKEDYECPRCESTLAIGWTANVEVRHIVCDVYKAKEGMK
jgi:hypothetical protein